MLEIRVEGSKVKCKNEKNNIMETIFDVNDLQNNYSKIPMNSSAPNELTIVKMINQWFAQKDEEIVKYILINLLVLRKVIASRLGIRVLEIGCMDGKLSYELASILGKLNNQSSLFCVSNEIEIQWLERIATVEKVPDLNYFSTEYDSIKLEKNYFDIIVVNGRENFEEPYLTLKNNLDLLKEDGMIVCYCADAPFLESSFKLLFENTNEYKISHNCKIFMDMKKNLIWKKEKSIAFKKQVEQDLQKILSGMITEQAYSVDNVKDFIHIIDRNIDDVIKEETAENIELKVQLLEVKEYLLDFLIGIEGEDASWYREKVQFYLQKLVKEVAW